MNRRPEAASGANGERRDARGAWASSLRFSGFTVLIVALVAAGAIIVSPSLSTFVQQRREIAELQESVRQHREAVDEIDAEREKWKDPVYVRSQARERLFYVMPGETQLSVIDDVLLPAETDDEPSADLARIRNNWAESVAASFLAAGTTDASAEDAEAPSDTEDTEDPEDTPEETAP